MYVQATAALSPLVQTMKHLLYGFPEQPVDTELSAALAAAIWDSDLISLLIFHMHHLEFEVRRMPLAPRRACAPGAPVVRCEGPVAWSHAAATVLRLAARVSLRLRLSVMHALDSSMLKLSTRRLRGCAHRLAARSAARTLLKW